MNRCPREREQERMEGGDRENRQRGEREGREEGERSRGSN